MRLSRLAIVAVAAVGIAGCGKDSVTNPATPALAGVRFINGLADSSSVDVRMIDQVDWSFNGVQNKAFRDGTEHQPIEAKARHIRVFPNSANPAITSAFMVDTTISFTAGQRYTLLLVRETATHVHFVVIDDTPPTPAAGQIAIRTVNASTGAIDSYVVDTTTTAIPAGTPTAANVASLATSPYVGRAAARAAMRVTAAGSATVTASQAGPPSSNAPTPAGELPQAGVYYAGTAFSVYYFPRSVAGTSAPQTAAFTNPGIVWFVDRNPADK